MAGRSVKLAVGAMALAVAAGAGFGVYTKVPRAAANEPLAPAQVTSQAPEPSAPPALRDEPPAPKPITPAAAPAGKTPAGKAPVKPVTPKKPTGPCAEVGPTQLAVEKYLAAHTEFGPVTVDGKQSGADCATIAKFQKRYGVQPAKGYAGPVTGKVATRLAAAALNTCKQTKSLTVCVDLTSQTMWVMRDGKRILGPTTVRTGRGGGYETPAGRFKIQNKKVDTTSTIFKGVKLPYWQRFTGAMGFHDTPSYLYDADSPGSHGCINLLRRDAIALFGLTQVGTEIHIFGRK